MRYELHWSNDILWAPRPVASIRSAYEIRRILRFVILSGVKRSRRIFAGNVCIAVTKVRRFFDSLPLAQNDKYSGAVHQLDKLGFGGESPLTMRYGLHWSNDILWAPRPVASSRSAYGIPRILRFVILSEVKRSRRIFAPNVCIAVTKVRRFFDSLPLAQNDRFDGTVHQFGKLELV